MKVATPWVKSFLVIGLNTGMRKGEIYNLQWKNIDLKRRQIEVKSEGDFETKTRLFRHIDRTPGFRSI